MNLFDKIDNIQSGDTLIIAGNIPNTLPDDVYERIIEKLDGKDVRIVVDATKTVSYTHLRAHETGRNLVCRLLLEKKKIEKKLTKKQTM